jgi:predicted nucleic acid-binding protein
MTEIELLSYPGIMESELATIEKFLAKIEVVGIDDQVVKAAVDIRKRHKLRLPDAVIGASAIVLGATLWTHDAKLKSALGPVSYSPNLK